jgi:hypothetical protein
MRLTITAADFAAALRHVRVTPLRLHQAAWTALRIISADTADTVRARMPVASGRARESWANPDDPDGIYIELPRELTIIQGSQRGYIRFLNDGSSRQAPAGFIDAAERVAAADLARALEELSNL